MAILLVLLFALSILFLRRRPDRRFRSLSLSISLVFEQNKIFLSQLVLLSDCGLNTAFVALLFTDLLIVLRSLVVQKRRRRAGAAPSTPARRRPAVSSIPARRRRAVLSDRARRGTAVPSAPATHLSVGSSSLPVSEDAAKPKEEEEMCSFTVIVPQFDCAFGSNRKMVGQPTLQKLERLFLGLGVGSTIWFINSPQFIYTVSVPDCGLVLAHRTLLCFGSAVEDRPLKMIQSTKVFASPFMTSENNCVSFVSSMLTLTPSVEDDTALSLDAWTDSSTDLDGSESSSVGCVISSASSTDLDGSKSSPVGCVISSASSTDLDCSKSSSVGCVNCSSNLIIFGLNSNFSRFPAIAGVSGSNGAYRQFKLIETSRLTLSTSNSGNFEIFAIFSSGI